MSMHQSHLVERGQFATANASRYLQQLCKHFAHKVRVRFDTEQGEADLPPGLARLRATETVLLVEITADNEDGLTRARHVIDSHLERFAFRESFKTMDWRRSETASGSAPRMVEGGAGASQPRHARF
jgi:hypothetical protein